MKGGLHMAFYTVNDVMKILGVSASKAYKVMQALNKELKERGYVTVAGKVPKQFFEERLYCSCKEVVQ
jgi:hypothetical protein